jgi:ribosome-associated protein
LKVARQASTFGLILRLQADMTNIRNIDFRPELQFRTSRSGGKGGQNVNKVETRVELLFEPDRSTLLTDEQKELIRHKLSNRISADGILNISSEKARSQLQNKEIAIRKFYDLLEFALKVPRKRKKTRPHKGAVEKRLQSKKRHAEKKSMRKGWD